MTEHGVVVLRDVYEIKVLKIGWRKVTLRITNGDSPPVDRVFRKDDRYHGNIHLRLDT